MGDEQAPATNKVRWGRVLGWSGTLIALEATAIWLLRRLMLGKLFLFALPWDASANAAEVAEASASAKMYFWPGLVVVAVMWGLVAVCSERGSRTHSFECSRSLESWLLYACLALFLFGTVADIATTIAFFHRDGVDQELHPGIRLVSLALGRSVGPFATKLIQFSGVILIATRWPKLASYLFALAGSIYLLGAIYNLWVSMS